VSDDLNPPLVTIEAPEDARFAIVWSRFNHAVVSKLLDGAKACFSDYGVSDDSIYVVEVPGLAPGSCRTLRNGSRRASVSTPSSRSARSFVEAHRISTMSRRAPRSVSGGSPWTPAFRSSLGYSPQTTKPKRSTALVEFTATKVGTPH
jgi:hypothetical protein